MAIEAAAPRASAATLKAVSVQVELVPGETKAVQLRVRDVPPRAAPLEAGPRRPAPPGLVRRAVLRLRRSGAIQAEVEGQEVGQRVGLAPLLVAERRPQPTVLLSGADRTGRPAQRPVALVRKRGGVARKAASRCRAALAGARVVGRTPLEAAARMASGAKVPERVKRADVRVHTAARSGLVVVPVRARQAAPYTAGVRLRRAAVLVVPRAVRELSLRFAARLARPPDYEAVLKRRRRALHAKVGRSQ